MSVSGNGSRIRRCSNDMDPNQYNNIHSITQIYMDLQILKI